MRNEKAQAFVRRLLTNPALKSLTPLQQEEQILLFLSKNGSQLFPTLSSANFFPGANWEQIWAALTGVLVEDINGRLFPALQTIIGEQIDFTFISFFRNGNVSGTEIRREVYSFLIRILERPEVRRSFTGPFTALYYNVAERYLDQVFDRKEYAHFELTKVQRLDMGKGPIKNMINASLLLRPIIHILSISSAPRQHESTTGTIQAQYADKVVEAAGKGLKTLPKELLTSAVNSNVSFFENKFIEATARITAIFSSRCRSYNPAVEVDRGADTPDKSWFSIARRNHKFYGYDVKMIDEFYKIAAENGW
ncbi:MAG: hypothetical protein ACLFRY_13285 [Spirochaetia bacterium]